MDSSTDGSSQDSTDQVRRGADELLEGAVGGNSAPQANNGHAAELDFDSDDQFDTAQLDGESDEGSFHSAAEVLAEAVHVDGQLQEDERGGEDEPEPEPEFENDPFEDFVIIVSICSLYQGWLCESSLYQSWPCDPG